MTPTERFKSFADRCHKLAAAIDRLADFDIEWLVAQVKLVDYDGIEEAALDMRVEGSWDRAHWPMMHDARNALVEACRRWQARRELATISEAVDEHA